MTSEPPPVLTEVILSGPEIVLIDSVLVEALEQSGLSADETFLAVEVVSPLVPVYERWARHVRDLDSGACGLSVDGIGLHVVTVAVSDIPVLVLALKGHLIDLSVQGGEDDYAIEEQHVQAVAEMISRLEGSL